MSERHKCVLCGYAINAPEDEIEIDPTELRRKLAVARVPRFLHGSDKHQHRTTDLCMQAETAAYDAASYAATTGIGGFGGRDRISREVTEQRMRDLLRPKGQLPDDYEYYRDADD